MMLGIVSEQMWAVSHIKYWFTYFMCHSEGTWNKKDSEFRINESKLRIVFVDILKCGKKACQILKINIRYMMIKI